MRLFFSKTDSIYTILKRLEKLPSNKQVEIAIDSEHAFFVNQRWGRQVKEIITNRKLNVVFKATKNFNRVYFEQVGLRVLEQKQRPIVKLLKTFWRFLFDSKRFHLLTQNKQQYLTYLIFGLEVVVGIGLIWMLVLFFMPSATIKLVPAQTSEDIIYNFRYYPEGFQGLSGTIRQLSIPYQTGSIRYQYQMAISTDNIHHISNPSEWTVKIYNRTPNKFDLLANTKFIAGDGTVFVSKEPISIPAGRPDKASELKVKLTASEFDEAGNLIGVRGNIARWSKLTIKNIKESYLLTKIWAEAIENFKGWSTTSLGIVTEKDHAILRQKLTDTIYQQKLATVKQQFQQKNAVIFLSSPLVKTTIENIVIDGKIGEKTSSLKGYAQVSFSFLYVNRDDLTKAFGSYVRQRQADSIQLISIDPNSLNFLYENLKTEPIIAQLSGNNNESWSLPLYILPTKVSILQGYDFSRDIKSILSSLKNLIAGKTPLEAQKLIQTYPEISSSTIDLGVFGESRLPTVKSRINIKV